MKKTKNHNYLSALHNFEFVFLTIFLFFVSCAAPQNLETINVSNADTGADAEEAADMEVADFYLKDVDGRTHSFSDYAGHVIAINFWATWCEPCKKEMTKLEQLYNKYKEAGLMVLSISMDEPESVGEVRPFVKQRGFTFPVLLDTESQVTDQLNSKRAAPFSIVIDKKGHIIWTHEGYVPGDEKELEEIIKKAL